MNAVPIAPTKPGEGLGVGFSDRSSKAGAFPGANFSLSSLARSLCFALAVWFGAAFVECSSAATLPAGFIEETLGGAWNEAIGLTFAADGRMFVWERAGRVWLVENGVKASTPLIDISEEVGAWKDHGMLGFTLDPDFLNNGHLYLLYVVDHHHLASFGTPGYNPAANDYLRATIGRLTRYTARAADGFRSLDPASRRVLVGENITNGFPIVFTSHGLGSLVFGEDGTLLVSCGDGGSSTSTDLGSASETYYVQALAEGILQPRENVGTFRAQMTSSLAGKILRLDPATGDGVAGNPFFDPAQPRAARSRIWAIGLRNPFRMTLRPGTGSHRVSDARPGALFIGDVGYLTWEELDVCARPGMNFGWPIYEGMDLQPSYSPAGVVNQDAPNPLYGAGGCSQPYFAFRDLLKQATLGTVSWPNPCDASKPIPGTLDRFVHARPVLDWKQGTGPSRVAVYNGTNAASINVGAAGSPVTGPQFGGNCSIGGVWYTGGDFPAQYRNTYFHAEYGALWIKNVVFDSSNAPVAVRDFTPNAGGVVCLATHPIDGGLYYINWTTTLKRIRYVAGSNQPPAAVASLDRNYGPSPLTVQFTGTNSTDPEGLPLSYQWNFGDGTALNTNPSPVHVFSAPAGVPTRFDVKLRVTDRSGASSTNTVLVSVNNTPPQVTITSPVDGSFYPMTGDTAYACAALVSDAEHDTSQLTCVWQTILHHNNHAHSEPADTNCATTTVLSPLGCNGETYFYRVVLTVTDAAGLFTTREARLFPFCTNLLPTISWTNPAAILQGTALSSAQLNATADLPGVFAYQPPAGTVLEPGDNQPLSVTFTPDNRSNYVTTTAQVAISVVPPFPGARINFQPASAPVPAGYVADTGLAYGARTNGLTYGWDVDGTGNTKDRDSPLSADQRYDTFISCQKSSGGTVWEIAVPNDIYTVFLVAGDASNFDSAYKFSVEGVLALNGTPTTANRWISGAATVTVFDGHLTVSNAPGSTNNKICFIDIGRRGPLMACARDKSVESGDEWSFDAPAGTIDTCGGSNVTIVVLSTVTNSMGSPGNAFSATRAWRATDSCGNSSACSQTVTVVDTTPPLLTCAGDRIIQCGTAWNFDAPSAVDRADGTNVQITIVSTLTNLTCATGFMATRTWRAADTHGNHTECSQTVSAPPRVTIRVTCPPDKSVEYGNAWSFDSPTATTDSCMGSNLVVAVIGTSTNLAGSAGNPFRATRSWRATDSCGNSSTCSQTVTVVDTTPPSLTCAGSKQIRCGTAWDFDVPTAIDQADGTNVTLTVVSSLTNGTCGAGFTATRTWRAADTYGNYAECSQTVSAIPPVTIAGNVWCPTNYPASVPSDKPVSGVTMDLTGGTTSVVQTAGDGSYAFVLDAGGEILLTPEFTNSLLGAAGVTTVDISLLRRHILNLGHLDSPYKLLAADVNGSGSVTTLDLSLIRRVVLGITNRFPAGFWRFVPSDYVFPDPENPWDAPASRSYPGLSADITQQDFVAIKLGDVNNSWVPRVTRAALKPAAAKAMQAARHFEAKDALRPDDVTPSPKGEGRAENSPKQNLARGIREPQSERRAPARREPAAWQRAEQELGAPIHGEPPPPTLDAHRDHELLRSAGLRHGAIPTHQRAVPEAGAPVHGKGERSPKLALGRGPKPEVTFQISSHRVQPGDTVVVRVTAAGLREVTSAQCTLAWDPAVLRFAGTGGYGMKGLAAGNFGTTSAAAGRLAFSWDDPEALGVTAADGTILFAVSFTAIGSAGDISELALVDETTASEVGVNFAAAPFRTQNGRVTLGRNADVLLGLATQR